MINKDDWEKTQRKFIEYWNKENHDRPLPLEARSIFKKVIDSYQRKIY